MMVKLVSKISATVRVTFASLQYRDFRHFWLGQCVSLIGTWIQRTAQVWLVYTLTKSPLMVSILGVCQFVPIMLFSPFAGVWIDRLSKRKILLLTQTVFMIQAFALTALTFFNLIRYWHIFILTAVFGLTQTLDMPTRQSFFIEMVGKKDLINAISLNSTIINLAKIIGPAIAGIAIAKFGSVFCFFVNGLSYLAVIWGLFLIKADSPVIRHGQHNALTEIKASLQYIKKSPILSNTVIVMAFVCTFAMNNDVLIPVFAKTALGKGAAGYAALMSAAGVGSLCAALVMANIKRNDVKNKLLLIDALSIAVLQIITALTAVYWTCLILIAAIGFLNLVFINTANSMFQLNSDDAYRGRTMSVYAFLNQGSTPVGNFFAGTVMEHWGGGQAGFLACGLTTLLLCLPLVVTQRLKQFPSKIPLK